MLLIWSFNKEKGYHAAGPQEAAQSLKTKVKLGIKGRTMGIAAGNCSAKCTCFHIKSDL